MELLSSVNAPRLPSNIDMHVHEDNTSAHLLATQHKITSRTRHFNVKYHHFWQMVKELKVIIERCSTDEQRADYLTKGLAIMLYEACRKANQGW